MSTLFPTIGDVVAAGFWLGLGALLTATWRDQARRPHHHDHDGPTPPELPPGYRILPRPFDWHRDL